MRLGVENGSLLTHSYTHTHTQCRESSLVDFLVAYWTVVVRVTLLIMGAEVCAETVAGHRGRCNHGTAGPARPGAEEVPIHKVWTALHKLLKLLCTKKQVEITQSNM